MQSHNSRYKWNDNMNDDMTALYISIAVDDDIADKKTNKDNEAKELARKISKLNDQRKKEKDDNKRKGLNNEYLVTDSKYRALVAEANRLEELKLIADRNKDTQFRVTRLKDVYSRKEALRIDIIRNKVEDGSLVSASTRIADDIYRLEDYGVYMSVASFDELARFIRDKYFELNAIDREYIENDIPESIVRQFVELCAEHWKEDASAVIDNTASKLLYVPVSTIKEWHNDSAYRRFPLTDIKEALAIYGYTKTNAGRNDYTDRKHGKVIAFWSDRFMEIAGKVSLENENGK
ncbi:MAG: hypothetical protein II842_01005 [Butyrivibrio sp.]|nr:hypothetical protein [Butyrivibrio sp.]